MMTAVVYLAWVPLGLAPLERFLRSYEAHPAGAPHELVVVFNGQRSEAELTPFRAALAAVKHRALVIARPGLDIRSYTLVVQYYAYRAYCFLNSYSVLLADEWLAKLAGALALPGVGVVGASGSWESSYGGLLVSTIARTERVRVRDTARLLFYRTAFSPFPNPHIRTTGFMARADVLRRVRWPSVRTKRAAHSFEGGRGGLTRQVERLGLQALVVGRDGAAYAQADWPSSGTFRQGGQENLLIGDNRSHDYQCADAHRREYMARLAWGDFARSGAIQP